METKRIIITIELPMNSKQANNWANKNRFIESTVEEILKKIKNNLTTHSGNLETDDEIGKYNLIISEANEKIKNMNFPRTNNLLEIIKSLEKFKTESGEINNLR